MAPRPTRKKKKGWIVFPRNHETLSDVKVSVITTKDRTLVPATENRAALLKVTAKQKKTVRKLAREWQKPKAAELLAKRKYFVADGETLSPDASNYVKDNVLQVKV